MTSKNKIKTIREQLGYTQSDLAEQTNLSIRTIQRVESGQTIPKGHTLNVLTEALGISKTELQQQPPEIKSLNPEEDMRLKMINLSSLCFLGIPFGNILIPLMIWRMSKRSPKVDEVGKQIISFQIFWTLCTSFLLILSPFLQDYIPFEFPLILITALLAFIVNIYFIVKTAHALNHQNYDVLPLKIRFL